MKLFETIRENLARCFYDPNQSRLFNEKQSLAVVVLFGTVGSLVLFFIYVADDVVEYVSCAYFIIVGTGILVAFIDTILKTTKIFGLIACVEGIIEKSEWT